MKLPESNISTETDQVLQEQYFGIGNTGMVISILRSKLYEDPIMAICREIGSNARDAHREVGTPNKPIEIHFPTNLDPNYKVKDYGPGISPERMADVFIKFANSTKRQDNSQIGGFGLGGKCGFSYSDVFTIITVCDKIKRTYSAYIDETNCGKLALLNQVATEEPNGTTLSIPVSRKDFDKFIDKTFFCTEFWEPRPIYFGTTRKPSEIKTVLKGTGWSLFRTDNTFNRTFNGAVILMDKIPYSTASLDINEFYNKKTSTLNVLNNNFLIDMNIGEASLSASRDNLQFDDKTIKNLKNKIKTIENEVRQTLQDEISNQKTYLEACEVYSKFGSTINVHNDTNFYTQKFFWNTYEVNTSISVSEKIGATSLVGHYSDHSYGKRDDVLYLNKDSTIYYDDYGLKFMPKDLKTKLLSLHPKKTFQVIFAPKYDVDGKTLLTYDNKFIETITSNKVSSLWEKKKRQPRVVVQDNKIRALKPKNNWDLRLDTTVITSPVVYGVCAKPKVKRITDDIDYIITSAAQYTSLTKLFGDVVFVKSIEEAKKLPAGSMSLREAWDARLLKEKITDKILLTNLQEGIYAQDGRLKFFSDLFKGNDFIEKIEKKVKENVDLVTKHADFYNVMPVFKIEVYGWESFNAPNSYYNSGYNAQRDIPKNHEFYLIIDNIYKEYPMFKFVNIVYVDSTGKQIIKEYIQKIQNSKKAA